VLRGKGRKKQEADERKQMPEASFPSLILTLGTGALQHMGLVENPVTKRVEKDMMLAKHTIDMLDMLKKKTKGNLRKEEERLLEELLYELRSKYVKAKGKGEDVEESTDEGQARQAGPERREAES
jgi:hypothetical protein